MKLAIFDLDGTLYDSMGIWMGTAFSYMEEKGFVLPHALKDRLFHVSSPEAAAILTEAYPQLGMTQDELVDAWRGTMKRRYREDIDFKPGAMQYLLGLRRAGIPICVATLTPRDYFMPAFVRTGLDKLIDFSINAAEAGRDKRFPDIYLRCAERFSLEPGYCRVYEDSPLAAQTAADAGFEVWGVYDEHSAQYEAQLRAVSSGFVPDWRAFIE